MSITWSTSEVLEAVLTYLGPYHRYASNTVVACVATWVFLRWLRVSHRRLRTTELRGPPSESFIFGVGRRIVDAEDAGALYEAWAREYGSVYAVPSTLGKKRIVLCDTKAIAHFYSKETWTYIQTPFTKMAVARMFGKGLTWAHGEDHKRQRKALTPGFTIPAIRELSSIFYDAAYKAKGAWDVIIEASEGDNAVVVDVQSWMSQISFDIMGLAGFSHNFGALEGKRVDVAEVFKALTAPSRTMSLDNCVLLLGLVFPFIAWIPTPRMSLLSKFNDVAGEISEVLLARTQKELEMGIGGEKEERSIIGLLIKGASTDSEFHLTKEEITAQIKVLILAGYETTSISLVWALLELSRNPDVQTRLRNELLEHGADPTFDQLMNDLSYLDAVVHETLRVHIPVTEFTRIAAEDDVIPLSEPVRTTSGELVDRVTIAKGTLVAVTMESINRSVAIWGEDAKVFRPSRWLEDAQGRNGISAKARELQGHRHLLTFADGAKICLGRHFALTELKSVLTVLVKNFVFELRDGMDTQIEVGRGVLPRPRIVDEEGSKLPLRVRPYVA